MYSNLLRCLPEVQFDPTNLDHLRAYASLLVGEQGPLRFQLEFPHKSVLQMMERKIAMRAVEIQVGKAPMDVSALPYGKRINWGVRAQAAAA